MNEKIFIDTWAWIALASENDTYHTAATQCHQSLTSSGFQYVTSENVLVETMTLIFARVQPAKAIEFIDKVIESERRNLISVLPINRTTINLAWEMKKKFHDKPDISVIDFTSMCLMRQDSITNIFTGDKHFHQVGMGFRLYPEHT